MSSRQRIAAGAVTIVGCLGSLYSSISGHYEAIPLIWIGGVTGAVAAYCIDCLFNGGV